MSYFANLQCRASLLDLELGILKKLLLELKDIGKSWKADRQSLVRKPIFIYFTMRHLPELRADLASQMENIRMIRQQALDHGTKLTPEAMEDMGKMIRNELNAQTDRQVKAEKARQAMEKSQKDDKSEQDTGGNQQDSLLETFKKMGLSEEEATDLIRLYEEERTKKEKKDSAPPIANPSGDAAVEEKYTRWDQILNVDWTNGARAIIAQTYLELIRAWTANNGSRWLFHRVDSAGWKLDSWFRRNIGKLEGDELLPEGRSCYVGAVDAFMSSLPNSFATNSWPSEKNAVVDRIKQHKNRGIREDDFIGYAWILCFDWTSYTKVKLLADLAQKAHPARQNKARIRMLEGCSFKTGQSLTEIAETLRKVTDNFLIDEKTFAWRLPPKSISDGPYRTCWVAVKTQKEKDTLNGLDMVNLKKVERLTKCKLRTYWHAKDLGWVVAITGPKDILANAESIVRATMATVK